MNLRRALLLVVAITLVASLILASKGVLPAWSVLAEAALLGVALLFERSGYQPRAPDRVALRRTGERFIDPTSGHLMDVWEDPRTGAREYVAASEPPETQDGPESRPA